MLVLAPNLVLSEEEAALPAGVPLIGYDNLVTSTNVTAETEETNYPAVNVANPSTNQEWRAEDTTVQYMTFAVNSVDEVDYVGVARHNLGSEGISASIEGAGAQDSYQKVLLHFDGVDASTTITDSNVGGSAHTWTAAGNAQIDTAQSKFGGAALLCDGTGDWVTTADHADFTLGSGAFTIDCWFNCSAAGGTAERLAGQAASGLAAATGAWYIERHTTNVIRAHVSNGSAWTTVTGTTAISATGWHHCALVRSGNTLKLFIDGVQEGGDVAFSGSVNDSANALRIGAAGEETGDPWTGWIDEFRLVVGAARFTAAFDIPIRAYDQFDWVELVAAQMPSNDEPMMFVFTGQSLTSVRIKFGSGDAAARIAVVYVGKLLRVERGFDVDKDFIPFRFGRKTDVVNGFSSRGDYLGDRKLSEWVDAEFQFSHFRPDWYREYFDPFVRAARVIGQSKGVPFFMAPQPVDYPLEVGFCWFNEDPVPSVSPVTGRIKAQLKLKAIVE